MSKKVVMLIALIFILAVFVIFDHLQPPAMPEIRRMKLNDAYETIRRAGYVISLGELKEIPDSNCNNRMDVKFIPYKQSHWSVQIELNRQCIITDMEWRWRGFDL